jgi:hypothetical protein
MAVTQAAYGPPREEVEIPIPLAIPDIYTLTLGKNHWVTGIVGDNVSVKRIYGILRKGFHLSYPSLGGMIKLAYYYTLGKYNQVELFVSLRDMEGLL